MAELSVADRLALADALCARLCHDIAGPLGTLIGSLELAAEDAEAAAEALPLAGEVAAAMGARLRLLRAAWTTDCGTLGADGLARLAGGLPDRVRVDLSALGAGPFAPPVARLLLNVLLLAVESLPRGGTVALAGAPGGPMAATLAGPSAAWPAALAQPGRPIDDPRTVQPPLCTLLAAAAGFRLSAEAATLRLQPR